METRLVHFDQDGNEVGSETVRGYGVQDAGPDEDQPGFYFAIESLDDVPGRGFSLTLDQLREIVAEAEAVGRRWNKAVDPAVTADAAFQLAFDRLQAAADALDVGASATNVQLADTAIRLGSTLALQGR